MRRFLTFALPLALVMGLSTTSFGATQGSFSGNEYSFDLGGPHAFADPISFDLALPYMEAISGFSFSGDFSTDENAFPIDLELTLRDSSGTELYVIGGTSGDDDWDGSWPSNNSDGSYSDSFSFSPIALAGELDTYVTIDLENGFFDDEMIWDNVSFVANVTAVPEPASAGLLGLGALVMLRRRRRSRVA